MSVAFKKIASVEPVANFLAQTINDHLKGGEKVLWLVAGGSVVQVAALASQKLLQTNLTNLSVTLTDERFVDINNKDSNWKQLLNSGFSIPGAKLFPVLDGKDIDATTNSYSKTLQELLDSNDYCIGLFGMGQDGHIAALFPGYAQLSDFDSYALHLNNSPKPPPIRITMSVRATKMLNEAIIYAVGKDKAATIENLEKNLTSLEQPAQLLKTLPKLTIFNDYKGEEV